MSTVTCSPRIEFDTEGYVRLRVWDSEAGGDRYVYLHRLSAYAHGLLDDLWEEADIHHRDHDRWNNRPENLEARDPIEHRTFHLSLTD